MIRFKGEEEKDGMEIRTFEKEQAEEVSKLVRRNLQEINGKDYSKDVIEELVAGYGSERILQVAENSHFYVAKQENKIVGCGAIEKKTEEICELVTIFVLPEYHGKKIGRRIMECLEQDSYAEQAKKIMICASITAASFYECLGYTFEGGRKELDKDDLYHMEKILI